MVLALLVIACVLALLAAFNIGAPRVSLFPLAFAFYVLAALIERGLS